MKRLLSVYGGFLAISGILYACAPAGHPYHERPDHADDPRDRSYLYDRADRHPQPAGHLRDARSRAEISADYYFMVGDGNRDGLIDRTEQQALNYKIFREADVDRDGFVTYEEMVEQKLREMAIAYVPPPPSRHAQASPGGAVPYDRSHYERRDSNPPRPYYYGQTEDEAYAIKPYNDDWPKKR